MSALPSQTLVDFKLEKKFYVRAKGFRRKGLFKLEKSFYVRAKGSPVRVHAPGTQNPGRTPLLAVPPVGGGNLVPGTKRE